MNKPSIKTEDIPQRFQFMQKTILDLYADLLKVEKRVTVLEGQLSTLEIQFRRKILEGGKKP